MDCKGPPSPHALTSTKGQSVTRRDTPKVSARTTKLLMRALSRRQLTLPGVKVSRRVTLDKFLPAEARVLTLKTG